MMGGRACDGRESMGWEGEHVMGGRACDGREREIEYGMGFFSIMYPPLLIPPPPLEAIGCDMSPPLGAGCHFTSVPVCCPLAI